MCKFVRVNQISDRLEFQKRRSRLMYRTCTQNGFALLPLVERIQADQRYITAR